MVRPGESIQAAIDAAEPGSTILIEPGVYREVGNADGTNALEISKSHIRLVGLSEPMDLNAPPSAAVGQADARDPAQRRWPAQRYCGGAREIAPSAWTATAAWRRLSRCCPGVEPITETDPVLFDVEISGINIEGFPNNGLFTERLDGFRFRGYLVAEQQ